MFLSEKQIKDYQNDGVIIISEYINGISNTIKRNDVNSRDKDDVIGD